MLEISCPGVFLPAKQDVYLGVYLLNQYLETICFPPVFPIMIQQSTRFEKVFENAVDPGAVADILESFLTRFELIQLVPPAWEELAYYEENTRDFLFPEPRLTSPHPGKYREVLMKTAAGFPGIAPKLEFSTRTAIRECMFLPRNRFLGDRHKSQKPLTTFHASKFPLRNTVKPKESSAHRLPSGLQSPTPSPYPTRGFLQDQTAQSTFGNNTKTDRGRKPPFVVRHVDSDKPFGEDVPEFHSWKSRRKADFSNFPFPVKRASSLDNFAANVKVIKEPDERIVLRSDSLASFSSPRKSGKSSPDYSIQGEAELHRETSLITSQLPRSPSPLLDQPLLRERFQPCSPSTWKKIHERVCSLLSSHRALKYADKEDPFSEVNDVFERPQYSLKKYPAHEQRYF
ncbi:spermatogenesis associated 6-like protein isoform X3 [Erinaceus europaeus]|uniref:Spermatogenesis associated 6-like protein isoform X3 n=1 Tax=Erinaceus europaeus TaxID=9365 RepID=A0ABM3Y3Y2_ERIEU|nr:spermatogenesis associated 6-like protein isoform X3 [Erinaceus europaeus]